MGKDMGAQQDQVRVQLIISGRVQGVFFRASAVAQAQRLGVTGWVSNCPDGAVEAVAEGARPRIEELIAWCRLGSSGAQVTNVEVRWEAARGDFTSFRIRR